ncbi:MBL fold metallo-hydrolase [Joostella sp. CR20]|uniref:MBL fold metallo-hydrolase n=1 Tax=Joostella sp. CR20 TaxID=2804312 RepID=UPI00313CF320
MTKIHHLRNATMVIETNNEVLLVDPMLGKKGTLPTFTYFKHKAQKNPITELPENSYEILEKVTHCLITHKHPDHLDKKGEEFLIKKNIPVTCSYKDEKEFKKRGLNIVNSIFYNDRVPFLGGEIEGISARHGYGFIAKPMGNVMGFYIKLNNNDSIYLSADTIYTDAVHQVLTTYNPTLSIVAGGSAQLDFFKPLLMTVDDIKTFVKNAPQKVLINHLEAVNHCPTTRKELNTIFSNDINKTVFIPNDGDVVTI